jgi:uncharacterized protein YbcV (DUF1398 family)
MELYYEIQKAYKSARNYPDLAQSLIGIGIQSYTVDVVTGIILYRFVEGNNVIHADEVQSRQVAVRFDERLTIQAIRSNQQGVTTYPQFMDEIAKAGVRFYEATLNGSNKRVTYIGAHGQYEETIPVQQ